MPARLTEVGGICTLTTYPGTGTWLTFHLLYPAGSLSSKETPHFSERASVAE
jgi:hypothetical protein